MENLNFTKIIELKKRIDANILKLHLTVTDLKKTFTRLNTALNTETIYLGIDSFNFQIKLIEMKIENSEKIYLLITNRMYKEYYKLYKSLKKYLENTYSYAAKEHNYPVYKDLENEKKYEFDYIVQIREEMDGFIKYLSTNISLRKKNLVEFKDSESKGLMCNNYIIEEELVISGYEEKLNLFKKHLQTYNNYHYLYLSNCLNEIKNLLNVITTEIKIKSIESKKIIENNNENNNEYNNENNKNINLLINERILENDNIIVEEGSTDSNIDDFRDVELGDLNLDNEESANKK